MLAEGAERYATEAEEVIHRKKPALGGLLVGGAMLCHCRREPQDKWFAPSSSLSDFVLQAIDLIGNLVN